MENIYTSARVAVLENSLLDKAIYSRIVDVPTVQDAIRELNAIGVAGTTPSECIQNLKKQRDELSAELIDDKTEIEVLYYVNTFQNLKACIKETFTGKQIPNSYMADSLVQPDAMLEAVRTGEYSALPLYMADTAKLANETIMHSGDGGMVDRIIDKGCLEALRAFAGHTKHMVLKKYAYETIIAANIKLALRSKDALQYMVECPGFNISILKDALGDKKAVGEALATLGYADIDLDNIDAWCDKRIYDAVSAEKHDMFSPSPAICFILSLERQLKIVRMLLIFKQVGLKGEALTRRLAYV